MHRHGQHAEPLGRTHAGASAVILDLFGEQDQAGADGEDRQSSLDAFLQRLEETEIMEEFSLHGRFAAGQGEQVDVALQIGKLPYLERLRALRPPVRRHLGKRPLHRQHSNSHFPALQLAYKLIVGS